MNSRPLPYQGSALPLSYGSKTSRPNPARSGGVSQVRPNRASAASTQRSGRTLPQPLRPGKAQQRLQSVSSDGTWRRKSLVLESAPCVKRSAARAHNVRTRLNWLGICQSGFVSFRSLVGAVGRTLNGEAESEGTRSARAGAALLAPLLAERRLVAAAVRKGRRSCRRSREAKVKFQREMHEPSASRPSFGPI